MFKMSIENYFSLIIVTILCLGFVNSLGCCVSSDLQTCSTNAEASICQQADGTFVNNDRSCSTVRTCDSGCCILGVDSGRMTRGACQIETQDRGFAAINFMQTTDDCNKYTFSQEWGSCVGLDSYSKKTCRFVTRNQCAGEFFKDQLCSSVANSNCNKTEDQICAGNNIYFRDSCGNRDLFVKECDYNSGSVCKQSLDSNGYSAECADASCIDSFDFSAFVVNDLYDTTPVYHQKEIKQGEVWCTTNGNVPLTSDEFGKKLASRVVGTGLRFFSRYCVGTQIVTEPCADIKEAYCSGNTDLNSMTGTGGRCVNNDWQECLAAESGDDCDNNTCFWFAPENYVSTAEKINVQELNLAKCLPKVSGGIVDSIATNTACSKGDYSTTLTFFIHSGTMSKNATSFYIGGASEVASGSSPFIVLKPMTVAMLEERCSRISDCTGKLNWVGVSGRNSSRGIDFMTGSEINQILPDLNLQNTGLESYNFGNFPNNQFPILFGSPIDLGKGSSGQLDIKLSYKCVPRKPILNGDCSMCNKEGSLCSEYACASLGTNCEYFNTGGVGQCLSKGDISSPDIAVNCPSSAAIGIQQPINISVTTSESAYCRFNLESATANYDLMPYDLGNAWGMTHKTILTVPGSNSVSVGEVTQYPLQLKSGKYNVYIRCIDAKGNGDSEIANLCSFDVPKTPDENPPVILKFSPTSNSPIVYNSTVQQVSMLVNEPVECKWSLKDEGYDLMKDIFNCSNSLTLNKDISGFECKTQVTNVTKNIGNSTKFYVRCKDQPSLVSETEIRSLMKAEGYTDMEINDVLSGAYTDEQIASSMAAEGYSQMEIESFLNKLSNMETAVYSRNTNMQSTVYLLKPSEKLIITELTPKNILTLGPNMADWSLSVRTTGGGYEGMTDCKWKLSYKNESTAYSLFPTSQSTYKTQAINQNTEGDYVLSVLCSDEAGNIANYTGPLAIRYDRTPPLMTRVYNDKGSLKVTTGEPAFCKYTNILSLGLNCAFTMLLPNLTSMTDTSTLEHSTTWKKGVSYFIKCQDFYGNDNNLCGLIAKGV